MLNSKKLIKGDHIKSGLGEHESMVTHAYMQICMTPKSRINTKTIDTNTSRDHKKSHDGRQLV